MIEFRWVVVLTLWTLLIGPIMDFTPNAPTAHATRAKGAVPAKAKNPSLDRVLNPAASGARLAS